MVVVHPVRASQPSAPVAAARTAAASSRAQTGYSSVSQPNRVASTARPRVAHWYRWWWVLTRPGVARQPVASITAAPAASSAGTGPAPTAVIRPPSTTM